jgi:uncharacterized protein YndB with AHSA1/START domain
MTGTVIAANTQMLIRRPVREVFNAFVDPDITTKIWFTRSSGRVEAGKRLQWDWEMYGAGAQVDVRTVEQDKRIVIEWPYGPRATPTTVEWTFRALPGRGPRSPADSRAGDGTAPSSGAANSRGIDRP